MLYWIMFIAVSVLSYVVQASFQKKFQEAADLPLLNGMAGREVAVKMLADHGIHDVKVTSTPGQLTDNFNPTNKTVNLSQAVYSQTHVAAAAVAVAERTAGKTCLPRRRLLTVRRRRSPRRNPRLPESDPGFPGL